MALGEPDDLKKIYKNVLIFNFFLKITFLNFPQKCSLNSNIS